jgi:two-component system, response regulator RegA
MAVAWVGWPEQVTTASIGVPSLAKVEWEHIQHVLSVCGGNVTRSARLLGITRRTLQLKLKKNPPLR